MTTTEWAAYLNNREYSEVLSKEEAIEAKKDGIVIIWFSDKNTLCCKGAVEEKINRKNRFDADIVRVIHDNYDMLVILTCILDYGYVALGKSGDYFDILYDEEMFGIGTALNLKRRR